MIFIAGFLALFLTVSVSSQPSNDLLLNGILVILTQENDYHRKIASDLENDIYQQGRELNIEPVVVVLPDKLSHIGFWTVIPELQRLLALYNTSSWIYFCEESTVVNLENLIHGLEKLDTSEKFWMGFGLSDEEPSIIHHFAFAENPSIFKYPLFSAGFLITTSLLRDVVAKKIDEKDLEFSIDASHELALHIGVENPLIHTPELFCDKPKESCASYPAKIRLCTPAISSDEIFFAVKTCHKYHQNRVPIIQKTWGPLAKNIQFFSDVANSSIPTRHVGVKNTERGHCLKTLKILKLALREATENLKNIKWIVLVDDDTILSVERLQSLLACYKPNVVIGERYGYKVRLGKGYNYLTGGGGIAFGVETLEFLTSSCHCPEADSPDDMVLGICFSRMGVPLVHSPLFHQARPMDYAKSYLDIGLPVSFHKHWNMDPLRVYNQWFSSSNHQAHHTEL